MPMAGFRRWCLALMLTTADAAAALRVTLIRHGETQWNEQGLLQGRSDSPLTANGVAGAKACGCRLRGIGLTAAYTSPLRRASTTAELILAEISSRPPLVHDERLRERCFGAWEGLSWSTIQAEFADELAATNEDPTFAPSGGGESRQETLERALQFMAELADRHGNDEAAHVLVVTHSATATCLIKEVLGLRQEQRRSFDVKNTALNEFIYDAEKGWMLSTLGDNSHMGHTHSEA